MIKKISKSTQLKSKLNKAIIDTIVSMGGHASRKDIITAIQNSQIFDAWESEVLPSNKRRWRTAFDIQSNELVKLGRIVKQNGVWKILKEVEAYYEISNSFRRETLPNEAKPALPLYFLSPKDVDKLERGHVEASDKSLFDDLIEPPWMQIFRGKAYPQADDLAGNKVKMLRNAFLTYERKKAIESIDIDKKFKEFGEQLALKKQNIASQKGEVKNSRSAKMEIGAYINQCRNKLNRYRWETVRLIAATAAGIVIATLPTTQLTTRGSDSDSIWEKATQTLNDQPEEVVTETIIKVANPLALTQEIISGCIKTKLNVKVLNENEITLIVYDFHSMDENEVGLKIKLNLQQNVHGNVKVVIKKID